MATFYRDPVTGKIYNDGVEVTENTYSTPYGTAKYMVSNGKVTVTFQPGNGEGFWEPLADDDWLALVELIEQGE